MTDLPTITIDPSMPVPAVDYRYRDKWPVTAFIMPHNPDIQVVAANFIHTTDDDYVKAVATYMRDNYKYPLDIFDLPSTDGQHSRYHKKILFIFPRYQWKRWRYYVWGFPNEVIQSGLGYCAETANLGASLLIAGGINAVVVLGDVMRRGKTPEDDTLAGRHAWVRSPYKNDMYVHEYTIHEPDVNNLITVSSVCNRESDWSATGGIYYIPRAEYNGVGYGGDREIVTTMDLPTHRRILFGPDKTRQESAKVLRKELKREYSLKNSLLKIAWEAHV